MSCPSIASGVRVGLSLVEQAVCGELPEGVGTSVAVAITQSSATGTFTRASGSFVTEGYLPEQMVLITGSANPDNNGYWRVKTVSALAITVADPDDLLIAEASGAAVEIALEGMLTTQRNINLERDILETSQVRVDRQKSAVRHGFNRVTGSWGYELSLVAQDALIRGAMSGEWSTPTISSVGSLTLTNSSTTDHVCQVVRSTGSWINDGIRGGDVLAFSGAATATNDKNYQVVEVVNSTTLKLSDPGNTATADTFTDVTYPGRRIDIGTTLRTYSAQRSFEDIEKHQYFHTLAVNSMQLTMNPDNPVGGTFELLGTTAEELQNQPMGGSPPSTLPTVQFLAAFDAFLYEAGELNGVVTSLDLTLNNNRSITGVVGSKFSPGIFEGQATVEGTISAMFTGGFMYDRFFFEDDTQIYSYVEDPNGVDFIAVVLPRVKYVGATMDPPQEGAVIQEMPFRALATEVDNGGGTTVTTSLTIQISNSVSDQRVLG